jgi:alkyl hydroperoxide reductase subunit AhpC
MSVQIGAPAPDIQAEAYVPGESAPRRLTLAEYRGSWVVLFFYPRDFTFVCPTELHAFAELDPDFRAEDAVVVAASTDSYWSHKAWFESHPALAGVEYPVVADTTQRLSDAYGVLLEDGSALRGTFVIDPEGVVRYASVVDQNVGRSPDEVLRVLQALRTGELCPVSWRPGQPTLQIAA